MADPEKTLTSADYLVPPIQGTMGAVASFDHIFRNPDSAYQFERAEQRRMRMDLDIAIPLEQRMLTSSLLDWDIEPDDAEDSAQVAKAAAIRKAIGKIERFEQFRRNLQLAVFYGHSANQLIWKEYAKPIVGADDDDTAEASIRFVPSKWVPIHPDSVNFSTTGDPVVKVRATYDNPLLGEIVHTENARAIKPNEVGRMMLVVNVMNLEAGDFELPMEAGTVFSGRTLRSILFESWYLKQSVLKMAVRFTERLAWGTIIGEYRQGNAPEKQQMIDIIQNMMNDVAIALPRVGDDSEAPPNIRILEAGGTGWESFDKLVNGYFGDRFQKMILGQTLTTTTGGTGLGSGVAEAHESTFARIIRMDAASLDSSLTCDLIHAIERVNWPKDDPCCRFVSLVDRMEDEKFMQQIGEAVGLGLTVRADDVRKRLQLRKPQPEEETLGGRVDSDIPLDLFSGLDPDRSRLNGTANGTA
jgi:phage gp29-like protein